MPPNRFWTSDQHIGHEFVAGLRGFESVEDHDEELAENWDTHVRSDKDIVYVLGDISISPYRDGALEWFAARKGVKHLILGNHDPIHPRFGSRALSGLKRHHHKWFSVFDSINTVGMTTVNGQKVMMSHYPYSGEGARGIPERDPEFRLRDAGLPLLHGHTHASTRQNPDHRLSLHVGLDAWGFRLVPESAVAQWLQKKQDEE